MGNKNWKRLKRLCTLTLLLGRGGRKSTFFLDQIDNNLRFASSKNLETFETTLGLNFTSGEGWTLVPNLIFCFKIEADNMGAFEDLRHRNCIQTHFPVALEGWSR